MNEASGYDTFQFIRGQQDCRDGHPHKPNQSESYDAGYSSQYQLDEIKTNQSAIGYAL